MTQQNTIGEQRPRTFNPNEHLMKIKNRAGDTDYLPVQWRLVWFRELCPEGTIDTEEIVVDLDRECEAEAYVWNQEKHRSEKVIKMAKGYARYRAIVTDGKGGRATGTKSETAASFADYIEKAETGAIGRALAALGYGTQFASVDFDEGERIVDKPVDHLPATPSPQNNSKPSQVAPAPRSDEDAANLATLHGGIDSKRWEAFKVHVLERPVTDAQLTHDHIGRLMAEFDRLIQNKK